MEEKKELTLKELLELVSLKDAGEKKIKTYSGGTIYYSDIDSTLTQLANTIPLTFKNHGDRIEIHTIAE